MFRIASSVADFSINAALFLALLIAVPYVRADTPLEAEYRKAATDWADAVGRSDACLRKASESLLEAEAAAGAAAMRPTLWDHFSGAQRELGRDLYDSMKVVRMRGFIAETRCMMPGVMQSNLRTVVVTARGRLVEGVQN